QTLTVTGLSSRAAPTFRKRRCFQRADNGPATEIATHNDWCESGKSCALAGSFKVFQNFYVAGISVWKNRQVV
ncbi:MAG: hypothetical protein WA738_17330, partial [Candidatus Angelobacter sp.]